MNTKNLSIPGKSESLHAKLDIPVSGKIKQLAIFAHCFTCTSNLGIVKNISKTLTNQGIAVLRFDFTGLGRSKGDFADTNFTHNVADIVSVYNYLTEHYKAPEILIGHSLGGAAVLAAAGQLPDIKALATIGAPSGPSHVQHIFKNQLKEIEEKGKATVSVGGRPFELKKQFLDDIKNNSITEIIKNLKKPLLILHSPQDTVVEIENAAEIYKAAFHPKSFISLDGADHILSKKEDAIYAANVIGSWVERYIPSTESVGDSKLDHGEILTHLNLADGFTSSIHSDNHTIVADEPESVGGKDLGFAPYDLLNGSLGACTVMTLKMYAERKKWDLKEVSVRISNGKKEIEHNDPDVNKPTKKVDVFYKNIKFVGNLDDKQRARLLQIASKCPVHKTITGEVLVETVEDEYTAIII